MHPHEMKRVFVALMLLVAGLCSSFAVVDLMEDSDAADVTCNVTVGNTWTDYPLIPGASFSGSIPGITLKASVLAGQSFIIGNGTFSTSGTYTITTDYGTATVTVAPKVDSSSQTVEVGDTWSNRKLIPINPNETYAGSIPGISLSVKNVGGVPFVYASGTFTTPGSYTIVAQHSSTIYKETIHVIQPVKSVSISGNTEVEKDNTITLTASVSPSNASNKDVTWRIVSGSEYVTFISSSDTSSGGKVTYRGEAVGEVTVRATSDYDSSKYDEFTFKVTAQKVMVTKVTVTGSTEVEVGKSITLKAVTSPYNATDRTVLWAIESGSARITWADNETSTGGTITITGKVVGTVKLYAEANDKDGVQSAIFTVKVIEPKVPVESITISGASSAPATEGITLRATVSPSDAADNGVKWTISSGTGTITEYDDGSVLVTASSYNVTVRATATDGSEVYASKTLTFYPVYTVTFDPNGGTCTMTSTTWHQGKDPIILPEASRASDQFFMGWYTMASGGVKVGTAGDEYTPNTNTTLHAQWQEMSSPVTSITISGSSAVNVGETVTLSAVSYPETAADRKVRWSVSQGSGFVELSGAIDTSSGGTVTVKGLSEGTAVIRADAADGSMVYKTYEVVVKRNAVTYTMTLTYDLQGGTNGPENKSYTQQTDPSITINISTLEPTKSGYTFGGWSTTRGSGIADYQAGSPVTLSAGQNLILYAVWDVIDTYFDIYFDPSPGSGGPSRLHEAEAGSSHTFSIPSDTPTRSGYTFRGWTTIEGSSSVTCYAGASFTTHETPVTLYAVWTKTVTTKTYTLQFDTQSGYGGPGTMSVADEGSTYTFTIPDSAPSRPGYNFAGWGQSAGTGTIYKQPGDRITCNPGTTILYAVWTQFSYVLTLIDNDGTDGSKTLTASDSIGGHTFTIPSDYIPSRSGYTFDGWAESASGSAVYQPGDTISVESSKTLYAVWTKETVTVTYTIIYGHNDGTTDTYSETVTAESGETPRAIVTSFTPTRDGYTFLGWSDVSNATAPLYTSGQQIELRGSSTTTKLYAVWQLNPITYILNFDANDPRATNTPAPVQGTVQATSCLLRIPDTEPRLDGHVFLGWSLSKNASVASYAPLSYITVTETTTTLYAVWGEGSITWNLFFDATGGEGAPGTITESGPVTAHTFQIPGDIPTKEGYIFLGWSLDRNAQSESVKPNSQFNTATLNSTLYAIWKAVPKDSFSLQYDATGGEGAPTVFGPVEGNGSYETTIPAIEPVREGYRFLGWSMTVDGEVTYLPLMDIMLQPGTTTLYAVWQKLEVRTFELVFDLQGGSGDISVEPFRGTDDTHEFDIPDAIPARDGSSFLGWSAVIDGDLVCVPGGTYVASPGTTTLYALYYTGAKVPFHLHFECNGGINGPSDLREEGFGSFEFTIPDQYPQLEGYRFLGWSTTPDGKPVYTGGSKITVESMVTVLYAQWEYAPVMTTYALTLDANGGEMEEGKGRLTLRSMSGYAAFIIPSDIIPTKEGSTFAGWALTSDGTARFGLGDTFFTKDPESTLYAHWVPEGTIVGPIGPSDLNPKMVLEVDGRTLSYDAGSSTGISDNASYTWYFGDGWLSNAISGTHTYDGPGEYKVILRIISDGQLVSVSDTIVIETDYSGIVKVVAAVLVCILALFLTIRYFGLA